MLKTTHYILYCIAYISCAALVNYSIPTVLYYTFIYVGYFNATPTSFLPTVNALDYLSNTKIGKTLWTMTDMGIVTLNL